VLIAFPVIDELAWCMTHYFNQDSMLGLLVNIPVCLYATSITINFILCTLQMKELHTEELQRLTNSQNKIQEQLLTKKEQVMSVLPM